MPGPRHIAVIGGGPAGAFAAAELAAGGCAVTLLDEKLAWEKPCGGGLTPKTLARYPFLGQNGRPKRIVRKAVLRAANGSTVQLAFPDPFLIYSRYELNSLMLERAAHAGCELVRDHVAGIERTAAGWRLRGRGREYTADFLVIAAGVRASFAGPIGPQQPGDLGCAVGYYLPRTQDHLEVHFLRRLHGYFWIFPRTDHVSIGLCGKYLAEPAARMRQRLERYMEERGISRAGAEFYAHLLPALAPGSSWSRSCAGEGWAAVGDAAGLVDPITGEGIYYALRSAEELAACCLEGCPQQYPARLRASCGLELELAARLAERFYHDTFLGGRICTRMVQFARYSPLFYRLVLDLFAGRQPYGGLKERVLSGLNTGLREIAVSMLRGSRLTTDEHG
jgi:geranylgeranyl reductase family protein